MFIYILRLEHGKYYVGKTDDFQRRWTQHLTGQGSEWTRLYKPLEVLELLDDCDDWDEDKWTMKTMSTHGIENVRGGSFTRVKLQDQELQMLQRMLSGARDVCFHCGSSSHFASECPNKKSSKKTSVEITIDFPRPPALDPSKYHQVIQDFLNDKIQSDVFCSYITRSELFLDQILQYIQTLPEKWFLRGLFYHYLVFSKYLQSYVLPGTHRRFPDLQSEEPFVQTKYYYDQALLHQDHKSYYWLGRLHQQAWQETEAIEYYQKASLSGDTRGAAALCKFYYEQGDFSKSEEWAERSLDDPVTLTYRGILALSKYNARERAVTLWTRAAYQGGSQAMVLLADLEQEKDIQRSIKILELAAEWRDTRALNNLGYKYLQGNGVAKNREKAIEYFRKSYAIDQNEIASNFLK